MFRRLQFEFGRGRPGRFRRAETIVHGCRQLLGEDLHVFKGEDRPSGQPVDLAGNRRAALDEDGTRRLKSLAPLPLD